MNNETSINMTGKVVLITGANSGIGKYTAIGLAKMDANIVMFCRNEKKGQEALQEIKNRSQNDKIDLILCDLGSQNSIRHAVGEFKQKYPHLHVLINNAGVMVFQRIVTEDGFESSFGINYLGPFLLTNLLLDTLKSSTPSRIVMVGAEFQRLGLFDINDLNMEKRFGGLEAYTQSKIGTLLFTYEMARRLSGTGVTINALHPGIVRSNLMHDHATKLVKLLLPLETLFMGKAEKGARTSIYLASSPEVEQTSGKYFNNHCKLIKSSPITYDQSLQKRLWDESMKLTHFD